MKVNLYVRDKDDHWVHITTASNEQEIDSMMRYATYKVSYGYDIKIERVKDE